MLLERTSGAVIRGALSALGAQEPKNRASCARFFRCWPAWRQTSHVSCLGFGAFGRGGGTVDQLNQCHGRIVALPKPELQDAQVAAGALGITRPELIEKFDDDCAIAEPIECKPAIGHRRCL